VLVQWVGRQLKKRKKEKQGRCLGGGGKGVGSIQTNQRARD